MKNLSLSLFLVSLFLLPVTSQAKAPSLAFTCNAQVGDFQGQMQLFASGHTRYVFRKKGTKKLYACWLRAQYVKDLRQAEPGGLIADFHRSDSCKPEMNFSLKQEVPEMMQLRVHKPLSEERSATLAMAGVPGSYICNIKTDHIDRVKTFAVYGVRQSRGVASATPESLDSYPNFELSWDEN